MEKKDAMANEHIRYKKKSHTASTSKSTKRSDHKHTYGEVIIRSFLGFQWGRRCSVCGRVDESYWFHTFQRSNEFRRPRAKGKPAVGASDYLSIEEIQQKYPTIHVIEWDGGKYKEI